MILEIKNKNHIKTFIFILFFYYGPMMCVDGSTQLETRTAAEEEEAELLAGRTTRPSTFPCEKVS